MQRTFCRTFFSSMGTSRNILIMANNGYCSRGPWQMSKLVLVSPLLVINPLGRILKISKYMTEFGGLVHKWSRMLYFRLLRVGFPFQKA